MKEVCLIHIGDIHFPDLKDRPFHVDLKDGGMDQSWLRQVAPNKLQRVTEKVLEVLGSENVRGLLISGDLTTRGKLDGYKECVDYLSRAFKLTDEKFWRDRYVSVVPGNHDIDRQAIDKTGIDLFGKFDKLTQAWAHLPQPVIFPRIVNISNISYNSCNVNVLSLNTCIGCGETRHLPKEIHLELAKILSTYTETLGPEKSFELVGEQLDTPAVLEAHVDDIERSVSGCGTETISLLLGHHGVLPQALMRVALYTEMINGGYVRFRLATLGRPVIYCHGHIHQDPIEVVMHPDQGSGKLILISAPKFEDGFNQIRLFFTDRGLPVGCEVVPFRLEDHGAVRSGEHIRVPLLHGPSAAQVCDAKAAEYLTAMSSKTKRFSELKRTIYKKTGKQQQDRTVTKYLQELEWLGLIQILNRDEPPQHWQVQRVEP